MRRVTHGKIIRLEAQLNSKILNLAISQEPNQSLKISILK